MTQNYIELYKLCLINIHNKNNNNTTKDLQFYLYVHPFFLHLK